MTQRRGTQPPVTKRIGRPPSATDSEGTPVSISKYPKLAVYMAPILRAQLHAAAMLARKPVWELVNVAVEQYIAGLPREDKVLLEGLAKRLAASESKD